MIMKAECKSNFLLRPEGKVKKALLFAQVH